ncbi:MAG: Mov34/MPN/PAD-1 family protein [Thiohalomonadales bacterium]
MSEVIYSDRKGLVLFEEKVVDNLNRWRQFGNQTEAGGILIGYRRPPHIHVVCCTTPFAKDRRSQFSFLRCDPKHGLIARHNWEKTNGQAYYLGEWHTHPVGNPSASSVDLGEWKKLINSRLGPRLLFVIVGRSQWYVQLENISLTTHSCEPNSAG